MTKALISKCKEFSKPIFTYIEVDSDFNTKKRFIMNDVMFNINDGMDGFFIGFNNNLKMITDPFSYSIDILNYFAYIFKTIQIDRNIIRMSIGDKKK